MKALTVKQPYASLIMCGVKTIETRSWAPPPSIIGTRIAIASGADRSLVREMPGRFRASLIMARLDPDALPFSKMLGTVMIVSVEKMIAGQLEKFSVHERGQGFYIDGNFAWHLKDPEWLSVLAPVRGKQGLYDWEL